VHKPCINGAYFESIVPYGTVGCIFCFLGMEVILVRHFFKNVSKVTIIVHMIYCRTVNYPPSADMARIRARIRGNHQYGNTILYSHCTVPVLIRLPIRSRYGTVLYGTGRYLFCTIRTFFSKYCRKIHIAASTGARGRRNCREWSVYFSCGAGGNTDGGGEDLLSLPLVLLLVIFGFRKESN
jgi:hypothetical protein